MLVAGHAELSGSRELDRSQPFGGEVGELDLRKNYEPQQTFTKVRCDARL